LHHAEVVVVGTNAVTRDELAKLINDRQQVIDLANLVQPALRESAMAAQA